MKKKRVGVITIYRKNYGAFLQAYALQKALEKVGAEAELIRYDYYKDGTIFGLSKMAKPSLFQILKAAAVQILRYYPHKVRQKRFDECITNHLRESRQYYQSYKELEKNPPLYDIYITGSDQVFNPNLSLQTMPARILRFVKQGVKASYAASSGSSGFHEKYKDEYITALRTFDKVSVREEGLYNYLKGYLADNLYIHIDPVFLLNKDEWNYFSRNINLLKGKYIFYYRVLPQKELNEAAQIISDKLGLPIFVADGHDKFENQMKRSGFLSPEEWVSALANSAYVVTNSFHGAAFSINLNKKTSILIPPKGGERVLNLLKKCDMTKMIDNPLWMIEEDNLSYAVANQYVCKERTRSMDYLNSLCSLE